MKTIEDMKLELLSDNSNKFMQTLIDYDIKSKDKYGSNLLHYYIMNYDSIVHPAGVIISEFIKKGLDINDKRKDGRTALYLSVQCQLQDIFEILLNSNADIGYTKCKWEYSFMGSRYAIPWRWLLYRTTFEKWG